SWSCSWASRSSGWASPRAGTTRGRSYCCSPLSLSRSCRWRAEVSRERARARKFLARARGLARSLRRTWVAGSSSSEARALVDGEPVSLHRRFRHSRRRIASTRPARLDGASICLVRRAAPVQRLALRDDARRSASRRHGDPGRRAVPHRRLRVARGARVGKGMTWEERFHPLREEWVIVAAHRQDRPWSGRTVTQRSEPLPPYVPNCHLCPGNLRVSGIRNPPYTGIF